MCWRKGRGRAAGGAAGVLRGAMQTRSKTTTRSHSIFWSFQKQYMWLKQWGLMCASLQGSILGNTATWGMYPAICAIPSQARVKGQSPYCCDGCQSRRGMLQSGGWAAGFGGGESSSLVNWAHLLWKWPGGINIEYHIASSCSKCVRILAEINTGLGNMQKKGKVLEKKYIYLNEREEMNDNSKIPTYWAPTGSQCLARNKNNMEKLRSKAELIK